MWLVGDTRYRRRSVLGIAAALAAGRATLGGTVASVADRIATAALAAEPAQAAGSLSRFSAALQYGGKWIGGSASEATQIRPIYVGLRYRTASTGVARMAHRLKAPKTGSVTHVAFNVRCNRPSKASDRCDGGYVSSWTDSYSSDVDTAASPTFCASGGEYTRGDGGEIYAELRKVDTSDPDPDNWQVDESAAGLLGRTAVNGGLTTTIVEDFLADENYKWWALQSPASVSAGDILAIVLVHKGVRDAGVAVQERLASNTDMLYASDPTKRGGPVWGREWQGMWNPDGAGWRPFKGNSSESNISQGFIRYDDDTAYGPPTIAGQTASRDVIGGSVRARMRFTVPGSYPSLTVDRCWTIVFRNIDNPSDLVVELKNSSGTVLATATFAGSLFSRGAPSSSDSGTFRGGAETPLDQNATLTPGATYYAEFRSAGSSEYILQAHNANKVDGLTEAGMVTLVDRLPDWKVEKSTDGGATWSAWPGYGEAFPVIFRVV